MKEAIGASQIFVICLTFIILFSGYIAISVNYNKAFQIKDYIISTIEETPGGYTNALDKELETYLTAQGYTANGECEPVITAKSMDGEPEAETSWKIAGCLNQVPSGNKYVCSACIYEKEVKNSNLDEYKTDKKYYKAVSFFKFDLPVVNTLLKFKISGTSKYVVAE